MPSTSVTPTALLSSPLASTQVHGLGSGSDNKYLKEIQTMLCDILAQPKLDADPSVDDAMKYVSKRWRTDIHHSAARKLLKCGYTPGTVIHQKGSGEWPIFRHTRKTRPLLIEFATQRPEWSTTLTIHWQTGKLVDTHPIPVRPAATTALFQQGNGKTALSQGWASVKTEESNTNTANTIKQEVVVGACQGNDPTALSDWASVKTEDSHTNTANTIKQEVVVGACQGNEPTALSDWVSVDTSDCQTNTANTTEQEVIIVGASQGNAQTAEADEWVCVDTSDCQTNTANTTEQ